MEKETPNPKEITEDPEILTWTAPTDADHKHSKLWYALAGIVVASLLVYSFWTSAWSFAIVIALLTVFYFIVYRRGTPQETISIHQFGVQFGSTYTSWADCSGYWMLQGRGYIELHIERKRGMIREIVIQTGETNSTTIRKVLSTFIPELSDRREGLLDMIARFLKI